MLFKTNDMKKVLFSILTCLYLCVGFSQTTPERPKAIVMSHVQESDTSEFSFTSNYFISEYKSNILEEQMPKRYSEILELKINYETQIVWFKTLTKDGEVFLERFVRHFKYQGYEIH